MNTHHIQLRTAALIAGLAILTSVISAPFAEMFAFPKLVIPYKTAETAKNIIGNKPLFIAVIFGYLLTFICDIVITWALYILLRPVNASLSLLTAIFRMVYSLIALVALLNLVTAFRLLDTPDYLTLFKTDQLYAEAMIYLRAFKNQWYFGLIFFAVHLVMLGIIVFRSGYIPRALGIILIITGAGYLLTTIRPFLFPAVNVDFAAYTFYGELIFMLWLLFKGSKIKELYKTEMD